MDKNWKIGLHGFIGLVFLILPILIHFTMPVEIPKSILAYNIFSTFYQYLVFYFGFAVLYGWLVGKIPLWKRILWISVSLVIVVIIKAALVFALDAIYNQELREFQRLKWFMLLGDLVNLAIIMAVGFLLRIAISWFSEQRHRSQVEIEQKNQELSFLKAQVNPHFFFNTLNNIYSLVYKKDDDAPAALLKLSDIMRYMLYETRTDLVPLEKEVVHLKDYLELEQLRFRDPRYIEFNLKGSPECWQVPPMLLLSFVENAFKHGKKRVEPPGVEIDLNISGTRLVFRVVNYVPDGAVMNQEGIGLQNTKRRLELIYPDNHTLDITTTGDRFKVLLTLTSKPC